MADITWQYLISLAMIAGLYWIARRNRKSAWRRERGSVWFGAKPLETAGPPIRSAPRTAATQTGAADAYYTQYLQELGQLQRALASYAAARVEREEKATHPL
jgi:hypothetical protein